jgi:hypothetical protein
MSDGPFVKRLVDAVQVSHEATMQLQQLASELVDHCSRLRDFTTKLNAHIAAPRQDVVVPERPTIEFGAPGTVMQAVDINHMPAMLRSGPVRGER